MRERVLTFQRNHLSYAESRVTATNNKRANPKQNPTIAINAWRWFNFKNNIDEMKQKTKWMNTSFVSSNLPLRLKVVFDHEPRQSSVDKWRQSKSPAWVRSLDLTSCFLISRIERGVRLNILLENDFAFCFKFSKHRSYFQNFIESIE